MQCLEPVLVQCLAAHAANKKSKRDNKRMAVSAEANEKEDDNAEIKTYYKPEAAKERLREHTQSKTLFMGLSTEQMDTVIDAMFEVHTSESQVVIAQGDMGDNFYVVDSGEYSVLLKQKGYEPVHFYTAGDAFGELALMYNTPRAATVQCVTPGVLWALDRVAFRRILMAGNRAEADSTAQFLRSVPLLSSLTDAQRDAVGSVLIEEKYTAGDVIVRQGDKADSLYVIKTGTCVAHLSDDGGKTLGREVARMSAGGVFGESALADTTNAYRQASVVAANDVTMLNLKATEFIDLLGDLNELVKQNFNEKVLGSMEMFKVLSKTQQTVLVDSLQEERYAKDDNIIVQGEPGLAFYVLVSGSVRVTREEPEMEEKIMIKDKLGPGAYFGEMALLQEDGTRMATVTANEDTVVMSLDRETFTDLVGSMNDVLVRETEKRQRQVERAKRPPLVLADLELMKMLGVGTFGRVKMVRHKPTNVPYALKCMRKGQIVAMQQVAHVVNERSLLEMCDHPFLLTLVSTFQDEKEIYMVFDLILGGELFSYLRKAKSFDLETSRFYVACVASAFTYLHERKIAYRDLKPENLLFDADGYLKVVDFGFAKIVSDRTWTLCGTPDYLAPEVIQNKGHNIAADWWSFGILIYECMVGHAPFEAEDPMEIYNNILNESPTFPYFFPVIARDIIEACLDRNPVTRLGSLGLGSLDIVEHDFFGDLSFAELERRTIPAPIVPDIRSPFDAGNYDDMEGEEDEEDEDNLTEEEIEQRKYWESFNVDPSLFKAF
jgi:CRP-like cAMP-binding protein/serine/threonine protein kinase